MSTGVQETLRIATPEGVSLDLPLAGVGSRFVALFVDTLLQMLVFIAVIVLLVVTGADGFAVFAVTGVTVFALLFIYPVAFELLAGGRTPGKRWGSLRVVCDDGSPVTFRASALRNLVRLVDLLPGFFLVGGGALFATPPKPRLRRSRGRPPGRARAALPHVRGRVVRAAGRGCTRGASRLGREWP